MRLPRRTLETAWSNVQEKTTAQPIGGLGFSLSKRLSADGGTWQAVSDFFFGVNQPFEHDGVVW